MITRQRWTRPGTLHQPNAEISASTKQTAWSWNDFGKTGPTAEPASAVARSFFCCGVASGANGRYAVRSLGADSTTAGNASKNSVGATMKLNMIIEPNQVPTAST